MVRSGVSGRAEIGPEGLLLRPPMMYQVGRVLPVSQQSTKVSVGWRVLCTLSSAPGGRCTFWWTSQVITGWPRQAQRDLLVCSLVMWEAGRGFSKFPSKFQSFPLGQGALCTLSGANVGSSTILYPLVEALRDNLLYRHQLTPSPFLSVLSSLLFSVQNRIFQSFSNPFFFLPINDIYLQDYTGFRIISPCHDP